MSPPQGPVARYGADFHQSFASVDDDFTVEENSKAAIRTQLGMEVKTPCSRHQYNQYQHAVKECVQVVSHFKSSANIIFTTLDTSVKTGPGAQPVSTTKGTGAYSPG
jgi:predicted HNH restriction endonuclease